MITLKHWVKCVFLLSFVAVPLFGADQIPVVDQLPVLPPIHHPLDVVNDAPVEQRNFYSEFMYMLFVLAMMVSFLYLASWALKRIVKTRLQGNNENSEIKIIESRALSHKAILHVVEIDGQKIVLGESPTQITHITTLSK